MIDIIILIPFMMILCSIIGWCYITSDTPDEKDSDDSR